jgi:hypothetical protein
MGLGGDATFVTAQLGRLVGPAALQDSSRLGAPFGQTAGWFPSDDQIHFLAVKLIGLFANSPFTVGAVYFVLGFPAAALTAYWLLREIGASRLGAIAPAVLFSVLPGHQLKYEHLWLAGYWVVPLGLWLAFRLGCGHPLWRRPDGRSRKVWVRAWGFNARTGLIVVCVAIGDVYYLAFTLILMTAAAVLRRATGDRRPVVDLLSVLALMGTIAGAAIVLSSRGTDADLVTGPTPAKRAPGESEVFAGKFMDLILPWFQHRLEPLRLLTTAYNAGTDPTVEHPALGVVALAGVAALLGLLAARAMARRPAPRPEVVLAGVLTLLSLAFYTKGGLGSLVAVFGTAQIRTWSRLYLYIALFGLACVAWALTRLGRRRPVVGALAVAVVLALGVVDQTNPGAAPRYDALGKQVESTRDFVNHIEGRLPDGCSVFQLPVVQFPESPSPGDMKDYDHLLPFLVSKNLRWSYGAMRGTASADWQLALPTDPVQLANAVAAAGFCALEVDGAGYTPTTDPRTQLGGALGPPLAVSDNGRLSAFDLGGLAARSTTVGGAGWQVLHPVIARVDAYPAEELRGETSQYVGPRAGLVLGNMTGRVVHDVTVTLGLRAVQGKAWSVTLVQPDGTTRHVVIPPWGQRTVTATFDLPEGRSNIRLVSQADRARTLIDGRTVSGALGEVSIHTIEDGVRTAVVSRFEPR